MITLKIRRSIPYLIHYIQTLVSTSLCLLLVCGSNTNCVGQDNVIGNTFSPNTASLMKFSEIPVSLYSGIPQISVPIYNLKTSIKDISVSLDYHASGIRDSDFPSWVGLGWALNTGGIITRVVKGYPDDYFTTNYDIDSKLRKSKIKLSSTAGFDQTFDLYEKEAMLKTSPFITDLDHIANRLYDNSDTQYDVYYYNFSGYSGKFTYTNEGKVLMLTASDLKVEVIDHFFKITDGNGIVYNFNDTEEDNLPVQNGSVKYISSWSLSKLSRPSISDSVTFQYNKFTDFQVGNIATSGYIYYDRMKSFDDSYFKGYTSGETPQFEVKNGEPATWQSYVLSQSLMHQGTLPDGNNTMNILSTIVHGADTVKFRYSILENTRMKSRLDSISVISGSREVLKTKFSFDYFQGDQIDRGKCKLSDVNIGAEHYKFDYYGSYLGKSLFQKYNAIGGYKIGRDFWGYYNGEDEQTEFPYYKPYHHWWFSETGDINSSNIMENNLRNSAYMNPDYRFAQIATLKEIIYPTGGRTEFIYEGNQYSFLGFSGPSNVDDDDAQQLRSDSTIISQNLAISNLDINNSFAESKREFILHEDQDIYLRTYIVLSPDPMLTYQQYLDFMSGHTTNNYGTCKLLKFNETTGVFDVIYERTYDPTDVIGLPEDTYQYETLRRNSIGGNGYSLSLTKGRYKMECYSEGPSVQSIFNVTYKFNYKHGLVYNGGGLRIKSIKNISGTSPDIEKVYNYDYSATKSSGVLETPIMNVKPHIICFEIPKPTSIALFSGDAVERALFLDIYQDAASSSQSHSGIGIGYAKVSESMNDGRKSVSYYSTGSSLGDFNDFGFGDVYQEKQYLEYKIRTNIQYDYSAMRGLLKRSDDYNSTGTLQRQRFTSYSDLLAEANRPNNLSVSMLLIPKDITDRVFGNDLYSGSGSSVNLEPVYTFLSGYSGVKTKDSVVNYFGSEKIWEVVNYKYKLDQHLNPVKILKVNSNGHNSVTDLRYPHDFITQTPYSYMVNDLHIINPVIEEQNIVDGQNTLSTFNSYKDFGNNFVALDSVSSRVGNNNYESKLNYLSYDDRMNVQCLQSNKGIKTSYIWSYNQAYPIAKVVNVDYTLIETILGAGNLVSFSKRVNPTYTEVKNFLAPLYSHPALSNTLVTTYTFRPLVGMTSETDPKGKTTYYEYDSFQRLKYVKDQNGNIVKDNTYHYKP